MPKIFELDPHVADLIAAGEVVERPASVVKELMENSIDSGAGIITVEITMGGMTYIRVTDNGCGIAPEDVKTAFLRHATSKLRSAEGLEAIGTLGFRGEALAAIAAVSRIEIYTREQGSAEGVSVSLEAGEVRGISPAGCPEGTTIIVRDLFFNTPARLKFMKTDRAESSGISSAVLRCALSHPEASFRFVRDGNTEYHTPGDSRADSCIYSLLGRDFSAGLLEADSSDGSVSVKGYVSSPNAARGNRSYQFFFVNGRPIRSITLQAALEQAYANARLSGRFPSCVLYITVSPGSVDVNVHPAKTEIKFVSDKQVFDGVYYAALGALSRGAENMDLGAAMSSKPWDWQAQRGGSNTGNIKTQRGTVQIEMTSGGGFKSMDADAFRKKYGSDDSESKPPDSKYKAQVRDGGTVPYQSQHQTPQETIPSSFSRGPLYPEPQFKRTESNSDRPFRVIGEALNTYIVIECSGSVWFIDKHAAHERIHFDALKSGNFEPMSQALITPVICRHGHEGVSLLLENSDLLENLGFTVESFGDDAVAVRRIPADIDLDEAEPALSEICEELERGGITEPARLDNIFRTIACRAAIKAGKSSGMRELEALAARVMSGEVSYCPHGRPVAFELTKTSLDKSFKRI